MNIIELFASYSSPFLQGRSWKLQHKSGLLLCVVSKRTRNIICKEIQRNKNNNNSSEIKRANNSSEICFIPQQKIIQIKCSPPSTPYCPPPSLYFLSCFFFLVLAKYREIVFIRNYTLCFFSKKKIVLLFFALWSFELRWWCGWLFLW